ncbi:type I-B CRISPR-associated protein Cas7/Csh2 [Thermodesulfovibrio hydrogeniphilus]
MANTTLSNRHETLFLWEVRKSNPNGDPNGNEPRIDRYTKKCDVTDVCIKRSIRDYIWTKKGVDSILVTKLGEDQSETVTLNERIERYLFDINKLKTCVKYLEETVGNRLKKEKEYKSFLETPTPETLKKLLDEKKIKEIVNDGEDPETVRKYIIDTIRAYLCGAFIDLRMFGSVLALKGSLDVLGGPLTGPIQIEVGTSLHRVVQSNKQITSVMGSKEEKEAGIIGDTHCIEYGLFATSAISNENAAKFTGLTDEDHELFLKALWRGTRDRHTRSKNQVPRLLIDIEYNKPFHFGDLVNTLKLIPVERDGKPLDEEAYRSINDFKLDLKQFYEKLNKRKEIIKTIKFASNELCSLEEFKQGFDNGLKEKVCEILDIDYDPSVDIDNIILNDEAKKALEGIKGIFYCESQKILSINSDLSKEDLNKLLENPAFADSKSAIEEAYKKLKGV